MSIASTVVGLWLAATPPPSESPPPEPRPVSSWARRQTWPLVLTGGFRALGFKPVPPNPTGSIGTELNLFRRGIFDIQLGLEIGAFSQPKFARGGLLDASAMGRITAPFGLYGDLGLIVGAQVSAIPGTVYRAGDDGRLVASRAPWKPAARMGLGLGLGYDFGRTTKAPIRLFARYRQLVQAPFMAGNDLPAMGIATFSMGLAMDIGTWARRDR